MNHHGNKKGGLEQLDQELAQVHKKASLLASPVVSPSSLVQG